MVTLHSNKLLSSTKPAENPSTGCLQRSARKKSTNQKKKEKKTTPIQQKIHRTPKRIPLSCFWRRRLACEAILLQRERGEKREILLERES